MATWAPLAGERFVDQVLADCDLYGLDVLAVMANALGEGIGGQVGDTGSAYGPWQVHAADGRLALWAGREPYDQEIQEWAWSSAGIKYAVIAMASSGARGLRGHTAVAHIVRYYEKPADIAGAITLRNGIYDHLRELGAGWRGYVARLATGPSPFEALPTSAPIIAAADAVTTPNAAWRDLRRTLEHDLVTDTLAIEAIGRRLPRAVGGAVEQFGIGDLALVGALIGATAGKVGADLPDWGT